MEPTSEPRDGRDTDASAGRLRAVATSPTGPEACGGPSDPLTPVPTLFRIRRALASPAQVALIPREPAQPLRGEVGNHGKGTGPDTVGAGDASVLSEASRADESEHEAKLTKELRGLEKLAQKYESKAQAAAKKAGLDVDAMRADFEQASQVSDPDARLQQFEQVRARYAPALAQAIDLMDVDHAAARRELTEVVGELPHAHRGKQKDAEGGPTVARLVDLGEEEGLVGTSAWSEPGDVPAPPPPPPSPQSTQTTLTAPYGLHWSGGGATAEPATGRVSSFNTVYVGVNQQLAAVGSSFLAESNVRRVRVETTINVGSFYTSVGACWGYASAEVIINLKVLDGSNLVSSDRRSLSRSIAVILWISSHSGSGRYTLSGEFDHSFGTPRNYTTMAELETWAGGGGVLLLSPASAYVYSTTVERINVTLIRWRRD